MASHPRNAQVLPAFILGDHSQKRVTSGNKRESPAKKTTPKSQSSQSNGKTISLTHLNHPTITNNVTPFGGIGAQSSDNSSRRGKPKEIITPTEYGKVLETRSPSPHLIPDDSVRISIESNPAHETSSSSLVPPEDTIEIHLTKMMFPSNSSPSPVNVPSDIKFIPVKDLEPSPSIAQHSKGQVLPSDFNSMKSQKLANVENQNEKVGESHLSDPLEQEKSFQAKKKSALEKQLDLASEESNIKLSTDSHPPQSRISHSHTSKVREATTSTDPPRGNISIITDLDASHTVPPQMSANLSLSISSYSLIGSAQAQVGLLFLRGPVPDA